MPVGLLTLEIHLAESHSLKDKRQVLRSLKDRLRARHNVSVAEMEYQDTWQESQVGVAAVANSEQRVREILENALREAERVLGRDLVEQGIEIY